MTTLFVRYWVAEDVYRSEVVWAEPHWQEMNYAFYPVGLRMKSTTTEYSVDNVVRPAKWSFGKPVGERGVFRYALNDYAIEDLRFVEGEYHALRLRAPDIGEVPATMPGGGVLKLPVNAPTSQISQVELASDGDSVTGVELLGPHGQQLKSVRYSRDPSTGELASIRAWLPPTPIRVGGGATKVRINDRETEVKEWPVTYHEGGRRCVVVYRAVAVDGKRVVLPAEVSVYQGDSDVLLRRARLDNYMPMQQADGGVANRGGGAYAAFDDHERQWREMLISRWMKSPDTLDAASRDALTGLRQHFEKSPQTQKSVGEQLKQLHMLAMTDVMLGDDEGAAQAFSRSVSLLAATGLDSTLLANGPSLVNVAMRWRRARLADNAAEVWARAATEASSSPELLDCVIGLLEAKDYVASYRLLNVMLRHESLDPWQRFDAEHLACLCLLGIQLATEGSRAEPSSTFAVWSKSACGGAKEVAAALRLHLEKANSAFAGLPKRRPKDDKLRQQLRAIEERL